MGPPSDERAVSPIIGAVLLAGFVVAGIAIYQVQVVPDQNRGAEFTHHERVSTDLVQARNALLQGARGGEDGFVTVRLGTTYAPRLVGVNPPEPVGTLRTTDPRPMAVIEGGATDVTGTVCPATAETRFVEYRPGYHEFTTAPTTVFENTVLVERYDGGPNRSATGQSLVENRTISLVAVTGSFREQGAEAASFEVRGGSTTETTVTDPVVTVPTRLAQADWERLLDGEVDPARIGVADGNLTLKLGGDYTVACGTVGVGEEPPTAGGSDPETPLTFDQGASTSIYIHNVTKADVGLDNRAGADRGIVAARLVTFYDHDRGPGCGSCPSKVRIEDRKPILEEGDVKRTLNKPILLPAGEVTMVTLNFKAEDGSDANLNREDFVVFVLEFDDGSASTYIIQLGGAN